MSSPHDNDDKKEVVHVDFNFRRELAKKIEGNLASFCYQCGACVGDCPATTYGKDFNPREIMLKVLYGLGDELIKEDSVLWQCTNCYNCQERCPQEVKPAEVIISLKNMMADRGIYPDGVERVIEAFEKTGRTAVVNQTVHRNREKFGLPPLSDVPMGEIVEILQPGDNEDCEAVPSMKVDGADDSHEPIKTGAKKFAFFPGCLIPVRFPGMEASIRRSFSKLGVELVDLEGSSCCPDPIYFKSKDKLSWVTVAARNLCLAEEKGVDVVTNCSGCTATLSEAYHLLEDESLRAKVNNRLKKIGKEYKRTSRVRHCATLLRDEIGYEAIREAVVRPLEGLKVAIHYGCHLLKPSQVMNVDDPNNPTIMENLIAALGADHVRHKNWHLCCGKACTTEDLPGDMMCDLLRTVQEEEAELLCLICPTCFTQFDHGQMKVAKKYNEDFHTPPLYYFQLLAYALGFPFESLGTERQRFKPECLHRFDEAAKPAG